MTAPRLVPRPPKSTMARTRLPSSNNRSFTHPPWWSRPFANCCSRTRARADAPGSDRTSGAEPPARPRETLRPPVDLATVPPRAPQGGGRHYREPEAHLVSLVEPATCPIAVRRVRRTARAAIDSIRRMDRSYSSQLHRRRATSRNGRKSGDGTPPRWGSLLPCGMKHNRLYRKGLSSTARLAGLRGYLSYCVFPTRKKHTTVERKCLRLSSLH